MMLIGYTKHLLSKECLCSDFGSLIFTYYYKIIFARVSLLIHGNLFETSQHKDAFMRRDICVLADAL